MLGNAQNWEVFGYDTRQLGGHWVAAWRDLLWADDSPVRKRLDEVVRLRSEAGIEFYQGGEVCADAPYQCEAILLPDELMLARRMSLPLTAEHHLESALALEASANSPFGQEDTGYGWRLVERSESQVEVMLVIVSISTVMTYLGRRYDIHNPHSQEIWVNVGDSMVQVRGFGEKARTDKYRRRLVRSAVGVGVCALLLLLAVALATGTKRAELSKMEEMFATVKQEAGAASRMRTSLALANETVAAVNDIVAAYPNPHVEIARLTALLDDQVSINLFSMSGGQIRLRGRATDAASVMQLLTDETAYAEVTAPQAIVKVGGSDLEQFSLNILLRDGESG